MRDTPFISAEKGVAELTVRVVILAVILTVLLAMSNAYLALKLGILTSASIPAAIISMGVLRLFKNSTLLENNAVQTAASAGEAVAGGIVYTIPALVIIGYWHEFDYLTNFFIAACGGVLGVLFSIPLRRILVHEPMLRFPEGRAIAEVLKSTTEQAQAMHILLGGLIGGLIELLQVGLKVVASSWSHWLVIKRSLFGFGAGFSATMIGAGYLVGQDMAISIFLGAFISWVLAIPIVSQFYPEVITQYPPDEAVMHLWNSEMRYLGIGAMLFAGIWTFVKLVKPMINSITVSMQVLRVNGVSKKALPRTDKDIPMPYLLLGIGLITCITFLLFQTIFPLQQLGVDSHFSPLIVLFAVVYVLVIGFLFSVITAYFSGMVGVTASPGSSVVIAGMLFAAWLLLCLLDRILPLPLSLHQIQAAEAITVVIGSVVTGIAAIANDNTQDLKVGQLVGATPWKQQVMLLLGVIISALVIPPVMQLLFNVYGIAGVMPREGMDISHSLPAPTAALMAAITEAVFRNSLPWVMMLLGALVIILMMILNRVLRIARFMNLSILGIAMGMYLPLSSSVPLFIGGMIAFLVNQRLKRMKKSRSECTQRHQKGTLIACGLVAGSALMDVLLAIPFSLAESPNVLQIVGAGWEQMAAILGVLTTVALGLWIRERVCS
jgi:putative OPT family oligopeptide transporter